MFEAVRMPEDRADVASRAPTVRSKITNGSKMMAGVDGRSAEARRYRDLCMSFADDLGGASVLTEAQRALVFQAAALVVKSESMNGAMIRGEDVNVEQQTRVANALGRTLNRLGIKKREAKSVTLDDYLAARAARAGDGEETE
jgi:hypothetical protein